jgi:hypothetical protein
VTRGTQTDEFTRMLNVTDLTYRSLNQKLQRKCNSNPTHHAITTAHFRQKRHHVSITIGLLPSRAITRK